MKLCNRMECNPLYRQLEAPLALALGVVAAGTYLVTTDTLANQLVVAGYYLGISPERLAQFYRDRI